MIAPPPDVIVDRGRGWVAETDRDWTMLPPDHGRTCRRKGCNLPAVAALNRGFRRYGQTFDSWWPYCAGHLYGRRVVDGELQRQRWPSEVET